MSLSAALSIFASPSGLAPNGGEGAPGDDNLFAGLVEAETTPTPAPVSGKALTPGRIPADLDSPANDSEATIDRDGSQPVPVPSPHLIPLTIPSVETGAKALPQPTPPPLDANAPAFTVPSPLVATETLPVSDTAAEAASPPANRASAQPSTAVPVMASSATPVLGTDMNSKARPPVDAEVTTDRSTPVETASKAAAVVSMLDRSGQATARAAVETRLAVRPRDVSVNRASSADAGAPVATSDDVAADAAIDPAIVKAVRVPNAPVPVASSPMAPALATVLQSGENAAAVSPDAVALEATLTPGGDRSTGTVPAATPSTAPAASDIARPQAEVAPLVIAEPAAAPDGLAQEGHVDATPDTAPATPAAVTASGLSRASIETTALLSAQIARRLEGRSTRFDMALTPEGLGRVDVRVEIDADGQLAARLAFDNPAAATELRGRADELRRQLEDAGFTLSQDALDFSEREPSSGGQGAFERQQRRAAYAHRISSEPDLATLPAAGSPRSTTPRGVDVKV